MIKVYIYKVTVDNGGAPCVSGGILSLAICKPAIRSTAQPGNVILGFAANSLYCDNCLVYAANVTRHLDGREYFSLRKYASRPDCIYRWDDHRFEWKHDAKYHSRAELEHDLGEFPEYGRANVLLSEQAQNFRYFKGEFRIGYKAKYPHLKSLVEMLGRGHRVNFDPELRNELRQFMKRLWNETSAHEQTAVPETPCRDRCNGGDDDFVQIDC
jgi:Nucleotide modification associated domain 2